jgi:hypothetical protein
LRASVVVISWTSYGNGTAFSLMLLMYVMYVAFLTPAWANFVACRTNTRCAIGTQARLDQAAFRAEPVEPDSAPDGLILLAALAAQAAEDPDVTTARLLSAIGWVTGDGTELTELTAGHASWDTRIVLRRLGALTDDGTCARPRHRQLNV